MGSSFYDILTYQHVTGKTGHLLEKLNRVTFKVCQKSNKFKIRSAVEVIFGVKVKSVNVVNVKKTIRRQNNRSSSFNKMKKVKWKKAIVVLEQGYSIDFSKMK